MTNGNYVQGIISYQDYIALKHHGIKLFQFPVIGIKR